MYAIHNGKDDLFLSRSVGEIPHLRVSARVTCLHCYSSDIAHRFEMVSIMLQKLQCNVFMLSYRGYGASDGYPSQHGITRDAQAVKQPTLFLSGLQDEMVPPSHIKTLYVKAAAHNKNCIFVEFPNGMHMDSWVSGGDLYWNTVWQFLEQNASGKYQNITHQSENDLEEPCQNFVHVFLYVYFFDDFVECC
ncbi:hypothetical protein MKW92_019653 [Papaver armeniacum]|nr:hypothetical protein MKW92_019653 [Papaver armeniacum]